jgi:hypothetical protein
MILLHFIVDTVWNNSYLRYVYRNVEFYDTQWKNCPTSRRRVGQSIKYRNDTLRYKYRTTFYLLS